MTAGEDQRVGVLRVQRPPPQPIRELAAKVVGVVDRTTDGSVHVVRTGLDYVGDDSLDGLRALQGEAERIDLLLKVALDADHHPATVLQVSEDRVAVGVHLSEVKRAAEALVNPGQLHVLLEQYAGYLRPVAVSDGRRLAEVHED